MPSLDDFTSRIKNAFQSAEQRIEQMRTAADERFKQLEERYGRCDQLREKIREEIARPRLDALLKHFSNVEPKIDAGKHGGTLTLSFAKTPTALARVTLSFRLTPDTSAQNLVAEYDLEILPVFVEYEKHSHFDVALDQPDLEGLARWMDDRLVKFTETYLSLQFIEQYQQDQLVTDPVAETRFPKAFAAGSLEHGKQTYYFITEKTKAEFQANPERFLKT